MNEIKRILEVMEDEFPVTPLVKAMVKNAEEKKKKSSIPMAGYTARHDPEEFYEMTGHDQDEDSHYDLEGWYE